MTGKSRAEAFAAALQRFERTGDNAELCGQFADDAELVRPEVITSGKGATDGTADVSRFWEEYRAQFSRISTEFVRLDEAGDFTILEWISRGELSTGRPIEYRGVSLLNHDDEQRVARFATYFDTAAFIRLENAPAERG